MTFQFRSPHSTDSSKTPVWRCAITSGSSHKPIWSSGRGEHPLQPHRARRDNEISLADKLCCHQKSIDEQSKQVEVFPLNMGYDVLK